MIDDQMTSIKYLKEFDSGSGLKQNIGITGQILNSLARVLQVHKLNDNSFRYFENNGIYYREKSEKKEEIEYNSFLINTFMDDYISLQ